MDPNKIVFGTCDGTGADINVCLGFKPAYVKLLNLEDGGSLFPSLEFWAAMTAITAFAEGIKELTGTTYRQISGLTTTGIRAYAGGTKLQWSKAHGHWVVVGDLSLADVSEVYVDGKYQRKASTDAAYKNAATAILGHTPTDADDGAIVTMEEGFTIDGGSDADINVDTEQLIWMAIG